MLVRLDIITLFLSSVRMCPYTVLHSYSSLVSFINTFCTTFRVSVHAGMSGGRLQGGGEPRNNLPVNKRKIETLLY